MRRKHITEECGCENPKLNNGKYNLAMQILLANY